MFCRFTCLLTALVFVLLSPQVHAQSKATPDNPEAMRILVIGDSLSEGYGLDYNQAYPIVLQEALRQQGYMVNVYNGGRSGDTTENGFQRLPTLMQRHPDPHLVILALGANDFLRRLELSTTSENLTAILEYFQQRNIPVFMVGIKAYMHPSPLYRWRFNRIFPRLAKKYAIGFMPDFLDGVALNPSMNQADGMHPNAYGINTMVTNTLPYLLPAMDQVIDNSAVME